MLNSRSCSDSVLELSFSFDLLGEAGMVSACLFFLGVVLLDFLGDLSCCFTPSIAALAAFRGGRV